MLKKLNEIVGDFLKAKLFLHLVFRILKPHLLSLCKSKLCIKALRFKFKEYTVSQDVINVLILKLYDLLMNLERQNTLKNLVCLRSVHYIYQLCFLHSMNI